MKQVFIIVILNVLVFANAINAQDLHLISGNKIKTIEAGTFIEIELPSMEEEEKCSSHMMIGKFVGYENGHVKLLVRSIREPLTVEKIIVGHNIKTYSKDGHAPTLSIPKDVIMSIKRRSEKGSNTLGQVVGSVLLILSFGTLTSAGLAEIDENNSGGLLLATGLAELLTGTLLVSTFKYPEYITNEVCPQFTGNKKVWSIQ